MSDNKPPALPDQGPPATVTDGDLDLLLRHVEDRLFDAHDTVCLERARLVTEAHRRHAGETPVQRGALAFEHVLHHMTIDVTSNPFFAGNTSCAPRAWMLVPEFAIGVNAQVALETGMAGFLDGRVPDDITAFWRDRAVGNTPGGEAGIGHMSLDYAWVVRHGLEEVLQRIGGHAAQGTDEQQAYRRAMRVAVAAVLAWAERCAEAAEATARLTADPATAHCLRRTAAACRHVPRHPARNLHEGLQSIALVHLASVLEGQGTSISIGLPDRALADFADEAAADPVAAARLVRGFLLKVAANSFQGRGSKTQAITVGGARADGTDACNAVTQAFLDAFAATPVADPHLFLRWHAGLAADAWQTASRMLAAGRSMPLLVNDGQVVPGLREAGVTATDAWDYCIVGCNELGIPGRCCQSGFSQGMGFDDLELLRHVLREQPQAFTAGTDMLNRYAREVADVTEVGVERRRRRIAELAAQAPFPFCSACCRGCIETGADLLLALPYPAPLGLFVRGTANAANALAAIQRLVFEEHVCSLPELLQRVEDRDPAMLARLAAAPKWGNDDARADRWCVALNAARDEALRALAARLGQPPFAVCHVVRSLHHLDGRRIGATPDGRDAGEPVGDSIGAVAGTAHAGPTALLNSVLKLDAAKWFIGIYNLNLTLPAGGDTAATVQTLAEVFLRGGGQELQVSVLDANRLREAQRRPDRHRDLVVRVAGLNARFVELATLEQDELIRRADWAAVQEPCR